MQHYLSATVFFIAILFLGFHSTVQAQTFTFNYTGSVQTYTVPPGVTSLHIVAYGASATLNYVPESLGGKVEADLAVTPGQVLNIYVGGNSGWNGGFVQSVTYGISSGDATDIRIGGTALTNRVLVAGGAGAVGGTTPELSNNPLAFLDFNISGSAGGGLSADNGGDNFRAAIVEGNPPILRASGGKGGTGSDGGAGGSPNGIAGQLGVGGAPPYKIVCGAGGGGYYGGGSGGWNGSTTSPNGGGGGGGSSYTSSACTNVMHTKGVKIGNGRGLVTITPYCPTGSQPDIALTGNTIDILNNDITPSTDDNTDLGSAVQATGSITKSFLIKNTGSATLSVSSISFSGTDAALFSLVSPPTFPFTVDVGGSQTFVVKFTPTALGTKSASLVIINSDCDESIYKVSLQATGVCATDIRVTGNNIEVPFRGETPSAANNTDFGTVPVNTPLTKTFVIKNLGTDASLTISSIFFQESNGNNAPYFSLINPPTFPLSIPVGGSQTITVQCLSSSIGTKLAYIAIVNNHCTAFNFYSYLSANTVCPASTPEINVQGNGVTILNGDSSPSTADNTDFGDVSAGSPSDKTFVIQNLGNANLSISGISTSQIYYSTEFTLVNPPTFPLNIAAGGSQTITVRFQTSQQGSTSSKLIIYSNDCDEGEYDIALQGNAEVTPATGLNFDGDGDYVEIQDTGLASAITSSSGITIEYWFKGSNAQSGVRIQSGNDYIVMGWNNNKHIISSSGGSDGGVSMGAAATNGHWHHIAMTWEVANGFGTFSSYLDGSLIEQQYGSDFALPSLNYSSVYLGGLASDESMNGTLDKLRIWNVARTESEIKDNMSCDLSPQPGLLASYNFDQGYVGQDNYFNQMLFDDSGNSFGGILSNFALTGNVSNWVEGYSATPSVTIASNDADNSIASGTSVTFTATPTNGGATPSYQWKKNDVNVGTNSATYTTTTLVSGDKIQVEMTSSDACASPTTATSNVVTMTVTTNVCVNPAVYTVTGGGSYCAGGTGVPVGLSNSESGVSYQLKKDNVNIGSPIEGSGTSISFGNKTAAGVYTVVATRTVGACTSTMTGSVSVTITPSVTPSVMIAANPSGSITTGTSVTFTATPTNGGTTPTYVWKKNDVTISNETGATYTTTTLANGDKIKVEMTSNATCASPATATSSETTMSVTTPCTNPTAYTVTGGGSYCSGGTGVAVGLSSSESGVTYQLKKDNVDEGAAVAGTTMAISFGNKTAAGVYTVVATRTVGACTSTMTGSVTITITPTVTPLVSIVANPSGSIGAGTSVTFTATPTNGGTTPSYIWKKNNVTIPNETGATLTTTTLANGDKIKVEMTSSDVCVSPATATSDEITMTVILCVSPTSYNVTGGGPYCSGSGGSVVGLASSQTGVNYQLKKGSVNIGSAVAGTGSAISFGNQTEAGTYTVEATTVTGGCVATMSGNVVVSVVAQPTAFTVTGGGSFCQGGSGVVVGLSGSETGVSYQLKKGSVNIGSVVAGTGSSISFGTQAGAGTYTVEATKTGGAAPARIGVGAAAQPSTVTCTQAMTGSVEITVISLPTAYNVTGGGPYCSGSGGVVVGLASSESGVTYQLKKDNVDEGAAVAGTTMAISFGNKTAAGVYTVVATRTASACSNNMTGSVAITITPIVTPLVSIVANPSGSIGAGMSVTFTATPTHGGTTPSYQWKKNGNDVGTNSATYTDAALANGDKVTCVMTSNATCVSTPTATSNEIPMVVCPIGGETWTAHTAAEANSWRSVTYGNGLFVAVAASGANRVMTSPDGVNWTARTAAENNLWVSVIYANGLFVAVATDGVNRVMTSPDGINWTARTAAAASQWYSVTYGNGLFVAVAVGGDNRVMTSPDGINWTARTAVEANEWTSVTYGNGLFVAVAVSGSTRVMTSPDGINWTARTAVESSRWFSVTYGNGLYVAVAQNGTNRVMTSSDGINWTARTAAVPNEWRWVTYGGGLFVAIAEVGVSRVMCSRDGINWVARTIAEDSPWVSLIYGNGLFVAIAADGANRVVTSPGGDTPAVSIVSNDADNNIINGTSVTFTATPTNGGTTPSYIWKKNNVTIPNETGATLTTTTLANGDKIKVEMTSSDVCVSPATATSDEITMTVILCVSPTSYNVTGGGPYCSGSGGSVVGLASSQTGVNYQLKKGSVNIGSAVAGTGSAISFGNQTEAGTYTVEATTATGGCVASMSGNAVVTINTLPSLFSVTGGGSFCPGGVGVLVGLSGSESGVSYQLKKGDVLIGNALSGTGSAISFGTQTEAGTYTVLATSTTTSCTTSMTGSASVTTYALPTAVVSGTSLVCKGGSAVTVTFTGSNGVAPYTFSYQVNGGNVQTVTTTGGNASATVSQSTSTEGVYTYTLVSVQDANCLQTQTGSAVVKIQGKPTIVLNTLQQTLNEGNTQVFCDTDANPENSLQFVVSGSCVTGSPVWRVQVGGGSWSEWSATAPVTQLSNNQPHRYQAACDASCPVTYTSPIELTINYRASVPQNVSMLVDGVTIATGETKEVCSLTNSPISFIANCGTGELTLYSVDGGEYSAGVPVGLVDNQFHNYRVRCRKSDGTPSCVESESGVMRLKLVRIPTAPTVSLTSTGSCNPSSSFSGQSSCGNLRTVWYNATTNVALSSLPSTIPSETTSYYARCQTENGCVSEKSNVVTFTVTPVHVAPIVTVSQDVVCTGTTVRVSANCPVGSTTSWNTGVSTPSFEVSFSNVTKQSYWAKCVFEGGCQSAESNRKEVYWQAFVVSLINIGESKSGIKSNDRAAWSSQFVTRDGGPELDQSTQQSPTLYYVENVNKQAPRYWTIHADACALGTNGSLTFDMLATPEMGVIRSFNTHENNAPYFMYANREGWTELYAQNHPAYGFYQDNGAGGNVYDAGLPKGLYKLSIRYWDMKGWGSIYPSTRKPQGNVLAYQEYWFRIQSKDGVGVGAAREMANGQEAKGKWQGSDNGKQLTDNGAFATVMPNPVTSILRLKVQDSKGQVVQTTLADASGRAILRRQFTPETNTHQEEFGVSELPTGMYFLKVTTSDKQATLKVVKVD